MPQPIPLEIPARDPRAELSARLSSAPVAHAEALLAGYEVLQALHDRGVLELLRGALGSGDHLVQMAAESANAPDAIRGIRNLLILAKTFGSVDPALVDGFARSLPEAIARTKAHDTEPPGVLELVRQFRSEDFRRGLVLVNALLEAFGRNLPPAKTDRS